MIQGGKYTINQKISHTHVNQTVHQGVEVSMSVDIRHQTPGRRDTEPKATRCQDPKTQPQDHWVLRRTGWICAFCTQPCHSGHPKPTESQLKRKRSSLRVLRTKSRVAHPPTAPSWLTCQAPPPRQASLHATPSRHSALG